MSPRQGPLAYDPNQVKPGWIAFFLVLGLLIATFLLWRSMNTQLSRIRVPHRASFRPDDAGTVGSHEAPDGAAGGDERDEPDEPAGPA